MNIIGKKTLIGPPKACRSQRTSFPANRMIKLDLQLNRQDRTLFNSLSELWIAIDISEEAIATIKQNLPKAT